METLIGENETTLRDNLRVLFRQKAVIIAVFLSVVITVSVGLSLKTPVYEAQVKMLVSGKKQIEASYYRDLVDFRKVEIALTQSEIVKSSPVLERVVLTLGLDRRPPDYEKIFCSPLKAFLMNLNAKTASMIAGFYVKFWPPKLKMVQSPIFEKATDDLKKNIEVEVIKDTDLFTITVKDFSPSAAAGIANVISRSYAIFDLEQQMAELQLKFGEKHLEITQLKDNIEKMSKNLSGSKLSNVEAIGPASVKIIEQAAIPNKPKGPPKYFFFYFALAAGLFLGVIFAFGFEYLDQSFKSPQEVEAFFGVPFLGYIPKVRSQATPLIKDADEDGPLVRSYRNLSDEISLLIKDRNLKSILITATDKEEAPAIIIANLGIYLSRRAGYKTLIIDADLRNRSMDLAFGTSGCEGFSEMIEGKTLFGKSERDLGSGLSLLPAGKSPLNPIILLGSGTVEESLKFAKENYDVILVNCAESGHFKDAALLSAYLDGIIYVVREGKTRRQAVRSAISNFEQRKEKFLGAILTERTFVIPKAIYNRI